MSNEVIAKYIDELMAFEKKQQDLKSILYKYNIDLINFENKAVDLLINLISEVSDISKDHIEYYIYELNYSNNHCYYENGEPIMFKNTLEFVEWIKKNES